VETKGSLHKSVELEKNGTTETIRHRGEGNQREEANEDIRARLTLLGGYDGTKVGKKRAP